jgi:hypothetical protein
MHGEFTRTQFSGNKKIGSLGPQMDQRYIQKQCHNGKVDSFKTTIQKNNNQLIV